MNAMYVTCALVYGAAMPGSGLDAVTDLINKAPNGNLGCCYPTIQVVQRNVI